MQLIQKLKLFSPSFLIIISQGAIATVVVLIDFIFSKKLSLAQFGIWKQIFIFLNIFIPLMAFGIAEGFKYYIAKEKNNLSYFSNLLIFLISIVFFMFIVIGGLNLLHFFNIINIKSYYLVSFFFPLAFIAFIINLSVRYVFINDNRINVHTKIILFFIPIPVLILLAYYFYNVISNDYFLYVGLFVYSVLFGLPVFLLIKKSRVKLSISWFNIKTIQKMLYQGFPLYIATFVGLFCINIDKILVSYFENKETFAVFAAGAIEIPIFAMLSAAFSNNDYPKLVGHIQNNNAVEAKNIWLKTTLNVSYIIYPLILFLMIFSKQIIFFVYSKNFIGSVFYFQTYLLVGLFRNNFYGALMAASGNSKQVGYYSLILLILNIIISYFLYNFIGVNGIVFGTLISTIIYTIIQLRHEKLVKRYILEFLFNKVIILLIILIMIAYFYF